MSARPEEAPSSTYPGRRARALLTLFIVLHWGAIAVWVAPATVDGIAQLPLWAQPAAKAVVSPVAHRLWPVAAPYLDLTSTRQNWTLFAPYPANWIPNVSVVAYFPASDAQGPGWRVDTLRLRGGDEDPYPHFLGHRAQRNLYQLGYAEQGGVWYRAAIARELCRSLVDDRGQLPEGVQLFVSWRRIRAPWETGPADVPYPQRLGGYTCDREESERRRQAPWKAYGLPDVVDPSEALVRAPAAAGGEATTPPPEAR